MTNQGDLQASIRLSTGTTNDYNGDWHALFDAASITAGEFNGRLILWLQGELGSSKTNLDELKQLYADQLGVYNWNSISELIITTAYNFATGLPVAFSTTRSGVVATYRDSGGDWQAATANVARLQHSSAGVAQGILCERAATNKANHKINSPSTIGDIVVTAGDGVATIETDATVSGATFDGSTFADLQNGDVIQLTGGTGGTSYTISATAGNTNNHSFSLCYKSASSGYSGDVRISDGSSVTNISPADTNWYQHYVPNVAIGNSIRYLQVKVNAGKTISIINAHFVEYAEILSIIDNRSATGSDTRNTDTITALTSALPFTENAGAISMMSIQNNTTLNTISYAHVYNAGKTEELNIRVVTARGFVEGTFESASSDQITDESHKVIEDINYPSGLIWNANSCQIWGGRGMRSKFASSVTAPVGLETFRLGEGFNGILTKMVIHSKGKPSMARVSSNVLGANDVGVACEGQSNMEGWSRQNDTKLNGGEIAASGELDNYYATGINFVSNGAIGGAGIYYRNNNTNYYLEDDGVTAGILTTQAIERINAIGTALKFLVVNIGETDSAETKALFKAGQKAFIDLILNGTHLTQVVLIPHGRRTNNSGSDANYQKWLEVYQELASENSNYHISPATYDCAMEDETGATDSVHINNAGHIKNAPRVIRKGLDVIGETVTGGLDGAAMTGATIATATITVTIAHDTGTDFTPTTAIENFRVFDTGGVSTEYTINSAVRASATTITIELSATPSGSVDVYYGYGVMYDVDPAQVIVDNSTQALPLQQGVVTTP